MIRGLRCLLPFAFLLLTVPALGAQPRGRGDTDAGKNGWLSDLDDGLVQAKKSGKPLMVVFRCVP